MSTKSTVRRKRKNASPKKMRLTQTKKRFTKSTAKKKTRFTRSTVYRGSYNKGFNQGYNQGYNEGFNKGFEEGFEHLYSAS
ncbi:hypothetical protein SAMN04487897_103262 [Paenibacillus sp. yr247]|uniref:hypothetical protein n=1 Tax=Paenibacillus sp. yr247 TaxID=1761880 RepID=UPI00088C9737|nr:hypothetical protein [Paenibacillus sp. yr247]SDN58935.1 hypothetical protein SAMN04487897_103262 [Paenibacillus sp. yr247]